eukprot:UN29036
MNKHEANCVRYDQNYKMKRSDVNALIEEIQSMEQEYLTNEEIRRRNNEEITMLEIQLENAQETLNNFVKQHNKQAKLIHDKEKEIKKEKPQKSMKL